MNSGKHILDKGLCQVFVYCTCGALGVSEYLFKLYCVHNY